MQKYLARSPTSNRHTHPQFAQLHTLSTNHCINPELVPLPNWRFSSACIPGSSPQSCGIGATRMRWIRLFVLLASSADNLKFPYQQNIAPILWSYLYRELFAFTETNMTLYTTTNYDLFWEKFSLCPMFHFYHCYHLSTHEAPKPVSTYRMKQFQWKHDKPKEWEFILQCHDLFHFQIPLLQFIKHPHLSKQIPLP